MTVLVPATGDRTAASASGASGAFGASGASAASSASITPAARVSQVRTACPYCGVGCGMTLHVEGERVVKVSGDATHPANRGRLCTKGLTAHVALHDAGRLQRAYVRPERAQPATPLPMDQAITETAQRLRGIIDEHGPDAFCFYVSGQMSIEAQYLANKLAKGFIRTNNIESNSRLCMASAGTGYKSSLGADGPPGSYDDIDHADVFFVIGANMADCHPILFLRMMDRVKAGAKLIVVDPRRTGTADKADLFMQIRPGTDLALLNGLLHLLHANGHTDTAFIAEATTGWEAMPAFLADYSPDKVAAITGIPEADIRRAADMIGTAPEWVSCWTMGLNQSTHGTWNTNAICNLHLATGRICRTGSGPLSLTGQPNAMGGREMGYMGPGLPGQRSVLVESDRAFIEALWQIPDGSLRADAAAGQIQGTVDMFERMSAGKIKACWVICTNPVASVPNRDQVIAGLQAAEVVICQDAFLDTETNRYADILLPGALWAEAEGVMINSERNMTLLQKAVPAVGEALPDWQIIARVASEMGYADAFEYADAAAVFAEICLTTNFKTGYDLRGASHERLRETPLQWPCAVPQAVRNPIRYMGGTLASAVSAVSSVSSTSPSASAVSPETAIPRPTFPTATGKAVFFARPHVMPAEMPDAAFPVVLNTGRLQHQWHTLTKTGKVATLNKLNPGPFVELHPTDAAALGIQSKDSVSVSSRRGHAILPAVVTDRVQAGNCFAPMHWNDVYGDDLCINAVTNDATDALSLQPELKYCAVSLARVETRPARVSAAVSTRASTTESAGASAGESTHISAYPCTSVSTSVSNNASNHANAGPFADSSSPNASPPKIMSRVDTLSHMLGLQHRQAPVLNETESIYMAGFLSGLATLAEQGGPADATPTPAIPVSAPLRIECRLWFDGVLAGMYSRATGGSAALLQTDRTDDPRDTDAGHAGVHPSRPLRARPKVLLLWSSQTGNVESLVDGYATQLMEAACEIRTACMSDVDVTAIDKAQYVLLMTSTFGDGEAPDNGQAWASALQESAADRLKNICFSVLALGDRNYDQFCGHGRRLDMLCAERGGTRLLPRVDCDVDYQEDADTWMQQVLLRIKESEQEKLAQQNNASTQGSGTGIALGLPTRARPAATSLLANVMLNHQGAGKDTRLIALSTEGTGLEYEVGDALGVWALNCPDLVDELLALCQLDGQLAVNVPNVGDMPLREALLRHFEIARPSSEMLTWIAQHAADKRLQTMLDDSDKASLKAWLWGKQLADVVRLYPVTLSAAELIALLKRMQPRLYSIASSPAAHPGEIHLTVGTVRYGSAEMPRKGVSSTFLADRCKQSPVPVFVQKSTHFRPPADGNMPMIMIGPGTGIAPFRAFLHERKARGDKGDNWLFFGEQREATDFYYRDELEAMRETGHLTRLSTAFSRDQSQKIYVQDRMQEQGAALWAWLQEGAYLYVCGDASKMAKDVDAALKSIVAAHGDMTEQAAADYVNGLAKARRYLRDVY